MDRLSQGRHAPQDSNPKNFKHCWICGKESNDICDFYMWEECDDSDKPEGIYLVICRSDGCQEILEKHERLYKKIPWAGLKPGTFMLLCGDCEQRKGFECTDSRTKQNGGEGLEVIGSRFFEGIICTHEGCFTPPVVYTKCEGYTKRCDA